MEKFRFQTLLGVTMLVYMLGGCKFHSDSGKLASAPEDENSIYNHTIAEISGDVAATVYTAVDKKFIRPGSDGRVNYMGRLTVDCKKASADAASQCNLQPASNTGGATGFTFVTVSGAAADALVKSMEDHKVPLNFVTDRGKFTCEKNSAVRCYVLSIKEAEPQDENSIYDHTIAEISGDMAAAVYNAVDKKFITPGSDGRINYMGRLTVDCKKASAGAASQCNLQPASNTGGATGFTFVTVSGAAADALVKSMEDHKVPLNFVTERGKFTCETQPGYRCYVLSRKEFE